MYSTVFGVLFSLLVGLGLVLGYFAYTTRRIAKGAERAVPPNGDIVRVDGQKVHYVEQGSGRPIVMIHGLGGSLHHMRRPLMENFGDGYRLIALDRPGSGYSTRARRATGGLKEQADFIAAFIDALKLDRPLLVGHSLGGAVALAAALDHPDKISGLALISPLTRFQKDVPPELSALYIRSPIMRRIVASTIAVPMAVKNAPQTLAFVFGPQQPPADHAVAGGALVSLRPSHFNAASTDAVALERDMPMFERRYGELSMPVGILYGTADRVIDYRRHGVAMQDEVADLDLELLEGVGHMPQYAETERVAGFIRRIAERSFAQPSR